MTSTLDREAVLSLRRRGRAHLPTPDERRSIRQSAGVRVGDLAEVLGVSEATVYAWELGLRNPGPNVRDRYLQALRLLGGADE